MGRGDLLARRALVEQGGAQGRGAAEGGQEPRGAKRVVTGFGDGLHPDQIRIEFLLTREVGERGHPARLHLGAPVLLQDIRDLADELLIFLKLGPLVGVAGGDMADLMGHDRRQFRGIVGQGQHAPRHIEIAAGKREGVDDRGVQDRDAIGLARLFAGGGEFGENAVQIALGPPGLVLAAEHLDEALVLGGVGSLDAGGAGRFRRKGGAGHGLLAIGVKGGATGEAKRQDEKRADLQRRPSEPPLSGAPAPEDRHQTHHRSRIPILYQGAIRRE